MCLFAWNADWLRTSLPAQRTAGGSTSATPAARPYTPTRLTSSCPASSAPPCPSREACTLSPSPAADLALPTSCGRTPTLCSRTRCTTTRTSTPPPTNTTWGPRPGRRPTHYPASEDTRTTTTWTQQRRTCTRPPAAPLTMTTAPDNERRPRHGGNGKRGRKRQRGPVTPQGCVQRPERLSGGTSLPYLLKGNASLLERGHLLSPQRGLCWHLDPTGKKLHIWKEWGGLADLQRRHRWTSWTWTKSPVTDWNRILLFCLCWMHFYFRLALFLFAFKKAIRYIVHRPPVG